jgi:hypothetical protein
MRFFSRSQTRSSVRPATARFRPQLESLENRCVPSTLKVTNLYDNGPGSLRYEIGQVTTKDNTIVFDKKLSGTITLTTGELVINKSLTIQGSGLTITSQQWVDMAFDSHNGSRIFEVDGASTAVTISGLTMTNGGGTRVGGGFIGNPYDGYGGAILNFGTLTLSGCNLGSYVSSTGSYAQYGGAIANFGTMTLTGSYVQNSTAYGGFGDGGGIYNVGTLTVSSSHVWFNSTTGLGGGIYNAGTLTVSSSILSNDAAYQGGGIYNAGTAAALTVSKSTFSSNSTDNIFGPYTDGGGNSFS